MNRPRKNADILGVPHKSRKQKEDQEVQTKPLLKSIFKVLSVLAGVVYGFFVILGHLADAIAILEWAHAQDWAALIAWIRSNSPWS